MEGSDLLTAGVLFLFAAVAAVPLASKLGIGPVLGYLLAGMAIGPWGLGFISDVDEILHFSELGVVFLMFIIGLELNPAKLWQLRRSIFGVGAAQVMLSAVILAGLLMLTHFSRQAAVVGDWSGDVVHCDGAPVDAGKGDEPQRIRTAGLFGTAVSGSGGDPGIGAGAVIGWLCR